jgi:putative tricarboxylic transport membrane protein
VSPAFYPRIVLAVTAVLALAMVAADLVARRARAPVPAKREGGRSYGLVAAAFGVFSAYVLTLPWLGFRIATLVFLVAMQALLEPPSSARRWAAVGVLALAATVVSYYVFEHYLHVLLPRGRWTDF